LLPASWTPKHVSLRGPPDQREFATPPLFEPARDHHLADQHARPLLDAELAVGQIGSLGHWRHDNGAREVVEERHAPWYCEWENAVNADARTAAD
jgi:hypothetical protein